MILDDMLRDFDRMRCSLDEADLAEAMGRARSLGTTTIKPSFWANAKWDCYELTAVSDAARRYLIAWQFGELEPNRALMLWKLQNGGVL